MSKTYFMSKTLRLAKGTVRSRTGYQGQRMFHNFISMKKPNGSWSKPALFKLVSGYPPAVNLRDTEVKLMRDIEQRVLTYNNDPVDSFTILSNLNGPTVTLKDPRGFDIDVDTQNFLDLITKENCKVENGVLYGPFVYAYSDSGVRYQSYAIRILKVDSDEYKNDLQTDVEVKETAKTLKRLDLEFGKVYNVYSGAHVNSETFERAVYLGRWKNVNIKYMYSPKVDNPYRISINKNNVTYVKSAIECIEKSIEAPRYVFLMLRDLYSGSACIYDPLKNAYVKNKDWRDHYLSIDDPDNVSISPEKRIASFTCHDIVLLAENNKFKIRELSPNQSIQIQVSGRSWFGSNCRLSELAKKINNFDKNSYSYPIYTAEEIAAGFKWWIQKYMEREFREDIWNRLGVRPTIKEPELVS